MNLFHHDEPDVDHRGPLTNFKKPMNHGDRRTSSFGRISPPSATDDAKAPEAEMSAANGVAKVAEAKAADSSTEGTTFSAPPTLDSVASAPPVVSGPPPQLDQNEADGPRKIGNVESSSARMHNPAQPGLFGQTQGGYDQFGNPLGPVIVGYDAFGNPIYQGQMQGNSIGDSLVQGLVTGMAAGVAFDLFDDIF